MALSNIKQGANENIASYVRCFKVVCYKFVGQMLTNDTIRHYFIQGFNKNSTIRDILNHRLTTLNDVIIATLEVKCRNPTLAKCEDETHTLKVGDLESSGTPENSEFDSRGQNTSHWGVLAIIGKVLKLRCPKWPRMSHLDICSPSYGQKKGRESNWQFDSQPQKVGNPPDPNVRWRIATWR
jgi:hypothetical protein